MIGNLTHIMQILLAFCVAYFAQNCPLIGEGLRDILWAFSLTLFTLAFVGVIITTGEYWGLWR